MAQNQQKLTLDTQGKQQKKIDETVEMFGVSITGTRKSQVLKKIFVQRKELLHLATVNPEFVMEARKNAAFNSMLAQTDLKVADGWGVVLATRLLSGQAIDRITGFDLVREILTRADTRGEKVFLLGALPGVAEKAAIAMKKVYPKAEIAWYEGARTVQVEKNEEASMTIAKINAFEPDYLLVAYGSPWQDMWIEENRPYLRARVAIGIGGVLDEWAGTVKKCPEWLDRAGGKWLWRFATQPWRWKRIARVIGFGFLVVYHKLVD